MSIEISAVVGLDLAGSPKRPTGFCLLRGWDAETSDLFSDAAILDAVRRAAPVLVAIDAPLNLPPGRTSIHERNDSQLQGLRSRAPPAASIPSFHHPRADALPHRARDAGSAGRSKN